MYSIIDSIINVFSSSLKPIDTKKKVSTIIESFWFNKERLMLLILSKSFFLDLSNLSSGERSGYFNMPTAVAKMGLGSLENDA